MLGNTALYPEHYQKRLEETEPYVSSMSADENIRRESPDIKGSAICLRIDLEQTELIFLFH